MKKTSFVPRSLLAYSFLGVVPACAALGGLAACSGTSNDDIALAIIAYDAAADADAAVEAGRDTRNSDVIIALADIGFRPDTLKPDDASDAPDGSDANDGGDAPDAPDAIGDVATDAREAG